MNNIPVVYITDNNYTMPTVVSITSLLENKNPDTNYKIHIIGINLSKENKHSLSNIAQNVEYIDLEDKYEDLNISHPWASKTTLFKYDIADFFKNFDKILYLDSDTIVLDDLSEFYNTDINNVYAGVIKDCIAQAIFTHNEKLNIKNYFNAGVMLLNIKKIRDNNLKKTLMENLNLSPDGCFEQDAFNLAFNDCVKYLHPKFNFMASNFKLHKNTIKKFYSIKEDINPVIIHYTHFKPWKYSGIRFSKLWIKYYKMSLFKNKKLDLKENPEKFSFFKKEKMKDRWVVDFLGLRFSYKKGFRDFRLLYP